MEKGLPAFCGKDHVCYCSHKYSVHDKKIEVNLTAMQSQFYDLYEKYFGPAPGAETDPPVSHPPSIDTNDDIGSTKGNEEEDKTTTPSDATTDADTTVATTDDAETTAAEGGGDETTAAEDATPAEDGGGGDEETTPPAEE